MNAMTASCAGLVVPRTTPKEIRTAAEIKTYILENRVIMIEYEFLHGIMKYSKFFHMWFDLCNSNNFPFS